MATVTEARHDRPAAGAHRYNVHHILTRLDLRSRWQVAEWAAARASDS
jgi:hypothetical protein